MRLVMHSYTFREYSFKHAVMKANQYGYEAIEICDDFFTRGDEKSIEALVDVCENEGVPVAAIDAHLNFTQTPELEAEAFNYFQAAVAVAEKRKIPRLNGGLGPLVASDPQSFSENGSILLTDELRTRLIAGMQKADAILERAGVKMTLEMHMNMPHDNAASVLWLLEHSGAKNFSANHDPGNLYAIKHAEEAITCLELVKNRLTYVHLKNCRRTIEGYSYSVPLERGNLDYYRYFLKLKEIGYRGDICIEYCGEGDPHTPAREDALYYRWLVEDLRM